MNLINVELFYDVAGIGTRHLCSRDIVLNLDDSISVTLPDLYYICGFKIIN